MCGVNYSTRTIYPTKKRTIFAGFFVCVFLFVWFFFFSYLLLFKNIKIMFRWFSVNRSRICWKVFEHSFRSSSTSKTHKSNNKKQRWDILRYMVLTLTPDSLVCFFVVSWYRLIGLVVKAVLNWKRTRTFSRAQQAPLFLNWPREHFMVLGFCLYSIHGSVRLQIEAPEEKPYLTRWRYTDPGETRKTCWEWQWQHIRLRARQEEQASGKEKDTDFGYTCVGIRRKYRREMQKTQRNLFGNPACKLSAHTHTHTHTHTHFITHDRFKAQHTRKGQQKCDVYSLRNGCDPLISWLPHTVRAEPRAACTVVQLARSSKK